MRQAVGVLPNGVTDELRRRMLRLANRQINRLQAGGRYDAMQQTREAREREFVEFGEVGIHEEGFKAKSLFPLRKTSSETTNSEANSNP